MAIGAIPQPAQRLPGVLRERWAALRHERPGLSTRDAALALGVSEAELLASKCGDGVTRLAGRWGALVAELPALGPIVAVTRNPLAVHEKRGGFSRVDIRGATGFVSSDSASLRLFFDRWHAGFAVHDGGQRSFEFFDDRGRAVHKVFLEPEARKTIFDTLVTRHASSEQTPGVRTPTLSVVPRPAIPVGGQILREHWTALDDPEDGHALTMNAGLTRGVALGLLGLGWAQPVGRTSMQRMLAWIVADHAPVTIGVASAGAWQRHTGRIRRILTSSRWLVVRDPSFHLRVRTDRIAEGWVVRAPSRDGLVSTLELLDAGGTLIATVAAPRWPGQMEPERWRGLVGRLVPAR
jgi:putative hemin transport protein